MRLSTILLIYAAILFVGFVAGRRKATVMAHSGGSLADMHSLPLYHGYYVLLCGAIPALLAIVFYLSFVDAFVVSSVLAALPEELASLPDARLKLILNDIRNLAAGNVAIEDQADPVAVAASHMLGLREFLSSMLGFCVVVLSTLGCGYAWKTISINHRARNNVESFVIVVLVLAASIAVLTTVGIVLSVLFEAIRFFQKVPFFDFLFGLEWSPQTAIREDQVGSTGAFGAVPLFTGTLMISGIAMLVAVPIGLMVAIYLAEYVSPRVRAVVKPLLEVLAGIPTVVYGYFAALTVGPLLKDFGIGFGFEVSAESALGAGLVMGIMILPFMSSISDDVINSVPQSLRDGSFGLGATKSETIKRVILPAALPGIVGGFLLAVSRAIGETMIVVMAAGLAANFTANPLEAVTTVTVQIVTLLVGDQEFDSAKTLAAFGLGLTLFVVTLILNVIALQVVRRFREQYD
ncbi:MAG: phosphate ABC transporter permease subunit PstC [Gammaproteobacteria bacterium]